MARILSHAISSPVLKAVIATYSITTLLLAWYLIFVAKEAEDAVDEENIGPMLYWHFLQMCSGYLWRCLLLIPLILFQYLPQILTTLALRTRGSISLVSLGLQILVFVVLGICQGLRLSSIINPSPNRDWRDFYAKFGYMWMNYLISVLGQVALFIVCIYVDKERLGPRSQIRLGD